MKIVSWNVAGLRACIKKGFIDFFENEDADVYCLQEVKALENEFDFRPEGYEMYLYPAEKKGYSGTLVFTRIKPLSVSYGIGNPLYDDEGRVITCEYEDFYLVNQYVPNVKRDLSRIPYRMDWEDELKKYFKKLEKNKPVVVCGDFNVAHNEIDIKNAKGNVGNAGFTYEERGKFSDLLASGFVDTFRYLNPDTVKYSWWTYIGDARSKGIGWRIDYFITSKNFIDKVVSSDILDNVYGSDHAPIELVTN